MATTVKLDWQEVHTDGLKGDMAKTFAAYAKAKAEADAAWKRFIVEAQPKANKLAPDGQVAVLIHKRGKLLIAFKDAPSGTTSASTGGVTL